MPAPAHAPAQEDLVALTIRLTQEFGAMPAGSVMRSVARVVWRLRRGGLTGAELYHEAERVSRLVLARRAHGGGAFRRTEWGVPGRLARPHRLAG